MAKYENVDEENTIQENYCCTLKPTLCYTCRKIFVCPFQTNAYRGQCEMYEPLNNPIEEYIIEQTTRSLTPIDVKEKHDMITAKEAKKIMDNKNKELAKSEVQKFDNLIREAAKCGKDSYTTNKRLSKYVIEQLRELGFQVSIVDNQYEGYSCTISWL